MVEIVNRPYARAFEAFASARPEVLCLSADLTSSCEVDGFRDRHPEQFLSLGMAEQNMLSFAGGLAMQGFRPFIHTFGVFLYRRPYDQLINSIAYSNRKVRLMGFLPGITTPGGITHQAIEDIAVMRTIPNMTVLETGDATEVETVLAGDVFYLPEVARRTLAFLARCAAADMTVLIGDPYRKPLPRKRLRHIADYPVGDMGQAKGDAPLLQRALQ